MFFHLPSFLLGYAAGLGTGLVLPRLRPVALEVASAVFRFADDLAARVASVREDLEDVMAEARIRVRKAAVGTDGEAATATATPHARA
ncbi:MAG TPA: hypothetical protein VM753_14265 [Anaeromyxobacter sp.]|nr:hypothetical protein [Anaeromyxobacter sp.]